MNIFQPFGQDGLGLCGAVFGCAGAGQQSFDLDGAARFIQQQKRRAIQIRQRDARRAGAGEQVHFFELIDLGQIRQARCVLTKRHRRHQT